MRFCTAQPVYSGKFSSTPTAGARGAGCLVRCRRWRSCAPSDATASSVGMWPALALSVSSCATSRRSRACDLRVHGVGLRDPFVDVRRLDRRQHHRRGQRHGLDVGRPTSWSSAIRLVRRSLSAAISCAVTRSKRACASRVSVMVAVPTSKLRLADASCSAMAVLFALRQRQRVLRRQHVEIGLRHAHDQVLFGGSADRPAPRSERSRLLDRAALARLNSGCGRQTRVAGRCWRAGGVGEQVGRRGHDAERWRSAWQAQRIGLRRAVLGRVGLRTRRKVGGVVGSRRLVDLAAGSARARGAQRASTEPATGGRRRGMTASPMRGNRVRRRRQRAL